MEVSVNEQIAEGLYKPVIKILKIRKIFAIFNGKIWVVSLVEMESLSFIEIVNESNRKPNKLCV